MSTHVTFYDTEIERQLAHDFDRLRARLLGVLDMLGDDAQIEAAKALVKDLTYTSQREIVRSIRRTEDT